MSSALAPVVERRALSRAANEVLIEVKAAAVNPSDVKAATGLMPYAVFPRTPGRDYAGDRDRRPGRHDRARGVRLLRRSRHPPRRHPCDASGRRSSRRSSRSRTAFRGRRRPASAFPSSPRWKVFAAPGSRSQRRDGAGDGRQRQGRSGRGADRELARRARRSAWCARRKPTRATPIPRSR